mgnify:FL=1
MKRDKLFIYIGTVVFFLLAIALGIIMFMMTKTASKLENEQSQVGQSGEEISERVSTEIGKGVNEQTSDNTTTNTDISGDSDKTEETSQNTNASVSNETSEANGVKEEKPVTEVKEEQPIKEVKQEITFVKPTDGEIIGEFANENLIYSETLKEWITHTAIDIKADKTSVIKSAADGVVRSIVNDPRYGLTVIVEHDDGYETVYSNLLTAEFVVEGEEIKQGQTIGTAGNTASFESNMECHLHFELLKNGEYLNPAIYLK